MKNFNEVDFLNIKIGDKFFEYDLNDNLKILILTNIIENVIYKFNSIKIYTENINDIGTSNDEEIFILFNNKFIEIKGMIKDLNFDLNSNHNIRDVLKNHFDKKLYLNKCKNISLLETSRIINFNINSKCSFCIKAYSKIPSDYSRFFWNKTIKVYFILKENNEFNYWELKMKDINNIIDFANDEDTKNIINEILLFYSNINVIHDETTMKKIINEFKYNDDIDFDIEKFIRSEFEPVYISKNSKVYLIDKFNREFEEILFAEKDEFNFNINIEKAKMIYNYLISRFMINPYTGECSNRYKEVYSENNIKLITSGHYLYFFKKYDDIYIEIKDSSEQKEIFKRYSMLEKLVK